MGNVSGSDKMAVVLNTFELDIPDTPPDEQELLQMLSDQLAYMIEYRLDFLLSLLYRMDVLEKDINAALSPECPEPANVALAKLVIQRHKQRLHTKEQIVVEDIEDLEEGLKL